MKTNCLKAAVKVSANAKDDDDDGSSDDNDDEDWRHDGAQAGAGGRQAGGFNLRLRLITNANAIKAALAICLHFNLI